MKSLVVDRDDVTCRLIEKYLAEAGCEGIIEPDRNAVFDLENLDDFTVIFVDLSVLINPIKYLIDLKSRLKNIPYIVFMDKDGIEKDAFKAGANGLMSKPVNKQTLQHFLDCGTRFRMLARSLNDPEQEFPYHSGIISNATMNELFLASLDRSSRYVENASLITFSLKNAPQLREDYGEDVEEQASQWVANKIIRLRRQSDILAQTGQNDFMILIQRPLYKDEPIEAAQRFRTNILQYPESDIPEYEGAKISIDINISVIELPTANKISDETIMRP